MAETTVLNELSGVIVVNKEGGMTSQTVVNKIKRIFGVKKAGHTGTLDPMATGVLPVLIGRGVKASEFMLTEDKSYTATLLLGETRDTEDVTGELLTTCDRIPTEEEVLSAVNSFVGDIMQVPPMYSALKVGGKKLCDMARRGEVIEREARPIKIFSIDCERISEREYSLDVRCSKGTYIRTLCADIGAKLGVGGVMKTLRRNKAAMFTLEDSHTLSEFENMSEEERLSCVYPVEFIFKDMEKVVLQPFFARLSRSGQEIYLKKIQKSFEVGTRVTLYDESGFFALGEVREFEDGLAIKPIRMFSI